jgi:Big-like domain-containing protein
MTHTLPSSVRRSLVFLLIGALGCGSDLTLPDQPVGGETVALTKLDGDAQVGTVGEALEKPLLVQVLTDREEPAVGRRVVFEISTDLAAGEVSPDTAVTNDAGQASAHWVLGTAPGPHVVTARLVDVEAEPLEFRADAKAAAPDTLRAMTPLAQPGRRQRDVPTPPVVRVVDRYGNPVPGTPVAWQVTSGEGQVSEPISTTDADGNTTVEWKLGNRVGIQKVTAAIGSVTGSPVTFTANVFF